LNADHIKIIGNRAQHGGDKTIGDDFDNASCIAGFVITDKPVVTMSPQSIVVGLHDNLTLRTIAAGVPPLSYQWRSGGTAIPGATTNSYSISNILGSASLDVVVTNLYGSTTSKVSAVTIDKILIVPGDTGTNIISWALSDAVLQSAPAVTGPYTDIDPPAVSPYPAVIGGNPTFYRYRRTATNVLSNPYDM